jgi:hypothetical protein
LYNFKFNQMKTIFLTLFTLLSLNSIAQTISAKPIYEGSQSLRINEMDTTGAISILYQDTDYKVITKITSFWVASKSKAIEMIDKALFILNMDKTDKDQNITDNIGNIQFKRYGFSQKAIYISGKNNKSLMLESKELLKIKSALETYSYLQEVNK